AILLLPTKAQLFESVSDDTLQALRILLPENLVLAALDLIDRVTVFKYETSWGRTFFEVFGSKGRYSVSVDLPAPVSTYCACPAFAYSVLLSDNQASCKHVLAVQIAQRLGKCVERTVTQDELVGIVCQGMEPEADEADEAHSA
ncbi:hypothetical protein JB92DRAFT_2747337, partial [Gautieria morchelliformis]